MANVNPIEIPIEVKGISQIRSEIKGLKSDLINATDPAEVERLSKSIGELSDKLQDANEKARIFAAGSDFEKVSNGLGLIKDQIADLDFEGAAETAKLLTSTIQQMNPSMIANGFKNLGKTVLELGKAFFTMGLQLLKNPLFLIAAIVAAVVIAMIKLKDSVKIVETAFNLMMAPINLIIDMLKELTDWLGITSFAADEAAEKQIAANKKIIESTRETSDNIDKEYSRQIALAKAKGQDTTQLELAQQKDREKSARKNFLTAQDTIDKAKKQLKEGSKEKREQAQKDIDDAIKTQKEEAQKLQDAKNEQLKIKATANTKAREEQKKADDKSLEQQKKLAEDRLRIQRQIQDLEVANMEEGLEKELALNELRYKRELEDLERSNATNAQKIRLQKLYLSEKEKADKDAHQKDIKRAEDAQKVANDAADKALNDLKKYVQDRENVLNNYNDFILDNTLSEADKQRKALKDSYDNQLKDLEKALEDKLISQAEYERRAKELKSVEAIKTAELEKQIAIKENEALIERYEGIANQTLQGLAAINSLINTNGQNRINEIQAQHSAELAELDKRKEAELSNVNLTGAQRKAIEERYAKQKLELDKKAQAETEKIKKQQFERDKALQIVQTVINTAAAVIKSFNNAGGFPAGLGTAAAMAAIGAIQLATIASQKYNGTASASGGGTPSLGSAQTPISTEGSTQRLTPKLIGNPFGNLGNVTSSGGNLTGQSNEITVKAIVVESDITSAQENIKKIESAGELGG